MKTANFPSLRVTPEVSNAAGSALESGASLSCSGAESVRRQIRQRRAQRRFIERGLASRDSALQSGDYYTTGDILRDLDGILAQVDARLTR
ncbi:prevent-host-death protein [Massilia rubra]|uniref:Prevent-host-death protein n=1 Tax=Massilia rubra TaxID=2607910 RepID=A0ABX0LQ55_9BURK|nr:prevent-host-death protein [Massilia rubra]NHZ34337.1 prevent-host-death protein [Massilia rubra]